VINDWACKINAALAKGVSAIIDIGTQLSQAKQSLGHGHFTKMVQEKVRFGQRQVQKYMRIADHQVLANSNWSSYLPGNISVLNMLASVKEEDLRQALDKIKAMINDGKKINLNSQGVWIKLIPALGKDAKKEEQKKAKEEDQTPAAPNVPSNEPAKSESSNEVGHFPSETNNTATDTPTEPAPIITNPTARETQGDEEHPLAKIPGEDREEPSADGREDAIAEEGDSTPDVSDDDNIANSQKSDTDRKVIPMPDRRSSELDPNSLTAEQIEQCQSLYESLNTRMPQDWGKYPKQVRITVLKWLLEVEESEYQEERQVA
jgi:hypothetical protein